MPATNGACALEKKSTNQSSPTKSGHGGKRAGAGRPKGRVSLASEKFRAECIKEAPKALKELVRLATKAKSEQARVTAINQLLDRAYGKAPQALTGEGGEGPVEIRIVSGVPRNEADEQSHH